MRYDNSTYPIEIIHRPHGSLCAPDLRSPMRPVALPGLARIREAIRALPDEEGPEDDLEAEEELDFEPRDRESRQANRG